jgi:transcriptional regulator GlxA family with amidase domain
MQLESIQFGTRRQVRTVTKRIAIFVYENCSFLDIGLIFETFELANDLAAEMDARGPRYAVSFLSSKGGPVRCSPSICVSTSAVDPLHPGHYDALFVAGGAGAHAASCDSGTIQWFSNVFRSVRTVHAAGDGALVLRAAGLPQSRGTIIPIRPTEFALTQSPEGTSSADADIGEGAPVITALSMVKMDFDYITAEIIAEQLMPNSRRWMAPLLGEPPTSDIATKIRKAARWMEEHCDRPISIEAVAQIVSMGERTFLRHFKAEMETTPSEFLVNTRLAMVCRLLITSTLPVDKIARRCGMGSGIHLAKVFKRRFGMSATDYRDHARSGSLAS